MYKMTFLLRPIAKQSVRYGKGGFFPKKSTKEFEHTIKEIAFLEKRRLNVNHEFDDLIYSPIVCFVKFIFPRPDKPKKPQDWSKSSKNEDWPIVRPDIDNLQKAIFDSLNGIIWKDDSQIIFSVCQKLYGDYGAIELEFDWISESRQSEFKYRIEDVHKFI